MATKQEKLVFTTTKEALKPIYARVRERVTTSSKDSLVKLLDEVLDRDCQIDSLETLLTEVSFNMLNFDDRALEIRNIRSVTKVTIRRLSAENLKADNIESLGTEGDVFINWIENSSKSAVKGEHILELIAVLSHLLKEYGSQVKYFVVSFLGDNSRAFRGARYLGYLAFFLEKNNDKIVFPDFLTALSDAEKNARTLSKTAMGLISIQEGDHKQSKDELHTLDSAKKCQQRGLNSLLTFSKALMKPPELVLAEFGKSAPSLIEHGLDEDLIEEFKSQIDPSDALRRENEDLKSQVNELTSLVKQLLEDKA